jgi:hypothetical protein
MLTELIPPSDFRCLGRGPAKLGFWFEANTTGICIVHPCVYSRREYSPYFYVLDFKTRIVFTAQNST